MDRITSRGFTTPSCLSGSDEETIFVRSNMTDLVGVGRSLSLLAQSDPFKRFVTGGFFHILVVDDSHITSEEFRSEESH